MRSSLLTGTRSRLPCSQLLSGRGIPHSGDRVCESHVILSDEVSHDKTIVSIMMSIVLDKFVKEKHAEVKKVFVFSDFLIQFKVFMQRNFTY